MRHINTLSSVILAITLTACSAPRDTSGSWPPASDTTPMGASNSNNGAAKTTTKTVVVAQPKKAKKPANLRITKVRIQSKKLKRLHLRNRLYNSGKLYVFFVTDENRLYTNDLNDIASYAKAYNAPKTCQNFVIEGHADFRGSEQWNMDLSRKRAEGVRATFLRNFKGCAKVRLATFGEGKPIYKGRNNLALRKNRRVVIIPEQSVIHRGLTNCPGDVYLLDMSGSMTEYAGTHTKWSQVQGYSYPQASKLFLFNTRVFSSNIFGLKKTFPSRNSMTAMFDSIYSVLQKMESGKKLTVLTDGQDNSSRTNVNSIIALANRKKIAISVVGIGLSTYPSLLAMVKKTNGKIFMSR